MMTKVYHCDHCDSREHDLTECPVSLSVRVISDTLDSHGVKHFVSVCGMFVLARVPFMDARGTGEDTEVAPDTVGALATWLGY